MTLPEFVGRWPLWYVALAVFVAYRGVSTCLDVWRARELWRSAINQASSPQQRSRLQGQRVGVLGFAAFMLAGTALLLVGSDAARVALAVALLWGVRRKGADFARGMAEGRKSAELAATVEYVSGRAEPRTIDWATAGVFVAVTEVLPAVLLLYSTGLS